MPRCPKAKIDEYFLDLDAAMEEFEINTPLRKAAFLAQLAHESGELQWFQEIWGPTPAQKRYEPPSRLSKTLGNRFRGDGKRYRGRGPIQLTGRANYREFGKLLGLPLEGQPDLAATSDVGFRIAGLYWKKKGLNELADEGDFAEITRRINGGYNGLTARTAYYVKARKIFDVKE